MAKANISHRTVRCGCGLEDMVVITTVTPVDGKEYAQVAVPPGWRSHVSRTLTVTFYCPDCWEERRKHEPRKAR